MLLNTFKNRNKLIIILILFMLLSFLIVIAVGEQGARDLHALYREKQRLISENTKLEQENKLLYRTIDRLKHDPIYVENIARKELGMIGKNEVIFKFKK